NAYLVQEGRRPTSHGLRDRLGARELPAVAEYYLELKRRSERARYWPEVQVTEADVNSLMETAYQMIRNAVSSRLPAQLSSPPRASAIARRQVAGKQRRQQGRLVAALDRQHAARDHRQQRPCRRRLGHRPGAQNIPHHSGIHPLENQLQPRPGEVGK